MARVPAPAAPPRGDRPAARQEPAPRSAERRRFALRPAKVMTTDQGRAEARARFRALLGVDHPEPAWWAWAVAGVLGLVGGVLRFVRLGHPPGLVFDETYYVKQAYSFLLAGHELEWSNKPTPDPQVDYLVPTGDGYTRPDDYPLGADQLFNAGTLDVFTRDPDFVVHPPLGKWLIAAGMSIEPDSTFFWRFSAAVVGTLSVVLIVLIARRLFDSTLLGGVAGLLLAVEGHHIVHSRTSLLDIFLSFWVLVAFALLLADRFQGRARLADRLARAGPLSRYGPWLGVRWYRVLAGVALGAACATKWSGLWFVAVFGLLTVFWDLGARRKVGVQRWFTGTLLKDAPLAFVTIVPVAAATYLASWFGWFRAEDSWGRQWAVDNPDERLAALGSLGSLMHYHERAYNFHVGLDSEHPYQANPWSWLVNARPTSFWYRGTDDGVRGCGDDRCVQAVTSVGNPVIWWAGAIAVVVCLLAWALHRDWRAGGLLAGLAAGYLPWFAYQGRTIYFFYAVVFLPFLVLALTYALGLVLGRPDAPPERRLWGAVAAGAVVVLAVAALVYFYPVWTGQTIPYSHWRARMFWPSWV